MTPQTHLPVYSRDLARVGEFVIKEDALRFRLKLEMGQFPTQYFDKRGTDSQIKQEFLQLVDSVFENMVTSYSILSYAQKKQIKIDPVVVQQKIEARKRQLNPKAFESFLSERGISYSRWRDVVELEVQTQQVIDAEIGSEIQVSLKEARAYYREHRARFKEPEKVRIRQIVTDSFEKAHQLRQRLETGENFAKMAINQSLSPDRARGGDLGYFARGSFPEVFDEVCFSLKKGELSPVVKSEYGYHIFKLLDRKLAGYKPFEEAMAQVQQKVFERKLKEKYDSWILGVKQQVLVQVEEGVMKSFVM